MTLQAKTTKQEIIEEKEALDANLSKLQALMSSAAFKASTDETAKWRAHAQFNAMAEYSRVLGLRIFEFDKPEAETQAEPSEIEGVQP